LKENAIWAMVDMLRLFVDKKIKNPAVYRNFGLVCHGWYTWEGCHPFLPAFYHLA